MIHLQSTHSMTYIGIALVVLVLLFIILRVLRTRTAKRSQATAGGEQIYVGNLSYRVRERHLRDYFSQYGNIEQLRIIKNHGTGRSKGFGFITYSSGNQANKALKSHGEMFEGRALVVRVAKPRD